MRPGWRPPLHWASSGRPELVPIKIRALDSAQMPQGGLLGACPLLRGTYTRCEFLVSIFYLLCKQQQQIKLNLLSSGGLALGFWNVSQQLDNTRARWDTKEDLPSGNSRVYTLLDSRPAL